MWLQTKVVGWWNTLLSGFAVVGWLTICGTSGAIAQETSSPSEISPSPEDLPSQENSSSATELDLSDIRAFAATTDIDVHSVESLEPEDFNALLLSSHQNQAIWANDPLWVGLQFLQFLSQPITGSDQQVSVSIPGEWEPGRDFEFARVVIEDKGWLDDAIAGERYVLWIVSGSNGEFKIQRALRANFCSRPFQEFYSSQNCP